MKQNGMSKAGTATMLVLAMALSACGGGATTPPGAANPPGTTNPGPNPNPGPAPEAGFITGKVVNEQGQPLAGVEVVADNTLGYNSNLITHTDANGSYKISVNGMPTTFKVSASMVLNYPPYNPKVYMVADGDDVVPGNAGGVVNFTMKIDDSKPYGSLGNVMVERGSGYNVVDFANLELTLTPVGKLADGSTGGARKVKLKHLAGWFAINIMYGTYKVTVTENGQPMEVRQKGDGSVLHEWGTSYTGGFIVNMWAASPTMFIEVRHRGEGGELPGDPEPTPDPTPAPGGAGITGTLSANVDLRGAKVFACAPLGDGCDEATSRETTVQASGNSVGYAFENLSAGTKYTLVGWKDVNGDGDVNSGDLVGTYQGGAAVPPPLKNADIALKTAK